MPQPCCWYTASAAPKRTSPTMWRRSRVDHRVVVFDLRGHGESGSPAEPSAYSLDRLAADVLAVADSLGLDTFRLLGHSMGGMVARRVVLAHPGRVDAARAHGHVRRSSAGDRPRPRALRCGRRHAPRDDGAAPDPRRDEPVGISRARASHRRTTGLPRVRRRQVVGALARDVGHPRRGDHGAARPVAALGDVRVSHARAGR